MQKDTTKIQNRKKISVSNEVKLDAKNPIPFELSGSAFYFYEGGERYIPFLDTNDNFFNTLLEAKLLSPTQNACISTRADYSLGNGISIDELKDDKKLEDLDEELDAFFKSANNNGDSFNSIIREIFDHLDTFGNCFIEIVRGVAGKDRYVKVYVWNTPECRLSAPKDDSDNPTSAIKSKRLLRNGILAKLDGIVRRPLMDKTNPLNRKQWIDEKGTQRCVIFLRNKTAGYPCYGLPGSISSLTHQLLEYKGARYNLDNFDNNLSIGGFIGLKGNFTEQEATNKGKMINKQFAGPGKAGRWVVVGAEQGLDGLDIKPFDNKREGSYIELDNKAEAKIILAHHWNKVLAGLDDGSALGKGDGYLKNIFDIALKKVIHPRQEFIIENFIKPLMMVCDDWLGTDWNKYTWKFKNMTPISFVSLIKNIDAAIKKNEVRSELGLKSDDSPKGEEYLSSPPVNNKNPNDPNNQNDPNNPKNQK